MTTPKSSSSTYRGHSYWRVVYRTGIAEILCFSRGITRSDLLRLLPKVVKAEPTDRPANRALDNAGYWG